MYSILDLLGDIGGLAGSLHTFAEVFIKLLLYNVAYNYVSQATYAYDDTENTSSATSPTVYYKFNFGILKEI